MPKIRTNRTKPPPEGYEDIADILEDYAKKMRDAENDTHEGKRKAEGVWYVTFGVEFVTDLGSAGDEI